MKAKALFTAVILILVTMLSGCEVQETHTGTDVYSRPMFSDSSDASLASGKELDVSHKHSEQDNTEQKSNTEDTGSTEASSSSNGSYTESKVTHITEQITTYYYYYETNETDNSDTSEEIYSDSDNNESNSENAPDSDRTSESDSEASDTNSEAAQPDTENSPVASVFEKSDLDFVINNSRIKLGDKISDYTDTLGTPLHITEIKNGDSEVIGKTYSYEDFSVDTVADESNEYDIISSIQIFSDNYVTEKGIKIGDSIELVTTVYGSEWMLFEDEYRYYIGNAYMYFYVQNDIAANIGYRTDKDMEN